MSFEPIRCYCAGPENQWGCCGGAGDLTAPAAAALATYVACWEPWLVGSVGCVSVSSTNTGYAQCRTCNAARVRAFPACA
jgi:hypothetical protein